MARDAICYNVRKGQSQGSEQTYAEFEQMLVRTFDERMQPRILCILESKAFEALPVTYGNIMKCLGDNCHGDFRFTYRK